MSYYVTQDLSSVEIDLFTEMADTQDEKVLAFFSSNPRKDFSPSAVYELLYAGVPDARRPPLTSIRRSMTTLTTKGFLLMVENVKVKSKYNRPEGLWRLR